MIGRRLIKRGLFITSSDSRSGDGGAGGDGAFGEGEKLERGGEMGRVACNWA